MKWLASLLVVCGGLSGVWALGLFYRQRTTVDPHQPATARTLVKDGIYRFTRNPMYLGLALLLGAAVLWWSALSPVVVILIFVAYMNRFQIEPEERALLAKFGQAYREYLQGTKRWL